jgi:hypothetical protein
MHTVKVVLAMPTKSKQGTLRQDRQDFFQDEQDSKLTEALRILMRL